MPNIRTSVSPRTTAAAPLSVSVVQRHLQVAQTTLPPTLRPPADRFQAAQPGQIADRPATSVSASRLLPQLQVLATRQQRVPAERVEALALALEGLSGGYQSPFTAGLRKALESLGGFNDPAAQAVHACLKQSQAERSLRPVLAACAAALPQTTPLADEDFEHLLDKLHDWATAASETHNVNFPALATILLEANAPAEQAAWGLVAVLSNAEATGAFGRRNSSTDGQVRNFAAAFAGTPTDKPFAAEADPAHADLARQLGVSPLQATILDGMTSYARFRSAYARPALMELAAREGIAPSTIDAVRDLFARAPIQVRFKPADGLADKLLNDPHYRPLHVTGSDTGTEDVRETIESRMFGYKHDVDASERPRYGALNVTNAADGQAHVFGDCMLILNHDVKQRATVHLGDAGRHSSRRRVGTFEHLDHVVLDALQVAHNSRPLLDVATGACSSAPWKDVMGGVWMEAQVHGDIDLKRDVHTFVLGAEAAQTAEGQKLLNTFKTLGIKTVVAPADGVADINFAPPPERQNG